MAAAELEILIEQGATFLRTLTFKDDTDTPIDLTGDSFRGMVRLTTDAATPVAEFTCTLLNQGTNPGEVTIELTPAETSAIPVDAQSKPQRKSKQYAYDIEWVKASGDVERVLQGIAVVSPEATK